MTVNPPASRVRNHTRHEIPSRKGHLDHYELIDGRTLGYLTADDALIGRLENHLITGPALADYLRIIENSTHDA